MDHRSYKKDDAPKVFVYRKCLGVCGKMKEIEKGYFVFNSCKSTHSWRSGDYGI